MPFVSGLYSFLAAQSGITAITGSGSTARIYPAVARQLDIGQALQPTLIYSLGSRQDEAGLRGDGYRIAEFDFVCLSTDYDEAHLLNDALEAALNFFRGAMGSYQCYWAELQDANDEYDIETGTYAVSSRYRIKYRLSA